MVKTVYTRVSFEGTPITEIGIKANEILALGWRYEESLTDHWIASFSKDVEEAASSRNADDEIKTVMGDYWIDMSKAPKPRREPPQSREDLVQALADVSHSTYLRHVKEREEGNIPPADPSGHQATQHDVDRAEDIVAELEKRGVLKRD